MTLDEQLEYLAKGAVGAEIQRRLTLTGSVLADDLDEPPVARALRVGDDDAIRGISLPPGAAETNANHVAALQSECQSCSCCSGLIARRANPDRTRSCYRIPPNMPGRILPPPA